MEDQESLLLADADAGNGVHAGLDFSIKMWRREEPEGKQGWASKEVFTRVARWVGELAVFVPTFWAFEWVFHNAYCNFLFQCGCTWNWAGGWNKCNVHNLHGPQCPWCIAPVKFPMWVWTTNSKFMLCFMTAIFMAAKYSKSSLVRRSLLPFACWVAFNTLLGIAFFIGDSEYPYFLFMDRGFTHWARNNTVL